MFEVNTQYNEDVISLQTYTGIAMRYVTRNVTIIYHRYMCNEELTHAKPREMIQIKGRSPSINVCLV